MDSSYFIVFVEGRKKMLAGILLAETNQTFTRLETPETLEQQL